MSRNLPLMQPTSDDCDAAIAALDTLLDLEPTLMLGAEENQRLLATAFGPEQAPTRPKTDDDITVDAPSPVAQLAAACVAQRPPPLKSLVLTSPPPPRHPTAAVVAAPASAIRQRIA